MSGMCCCVCACACAYLCVHLCVWLPTRVDPPQGQNTIWIYFVYCSIWITKTGAHIRTHQSCFLRVCVCVCVCVSWNSWQLNAWILQNVFPAPLLRRLFHFSGCWCCKTWKCLQSMSVCGTQEFLLTIWVVRTGGWTATGLWVAISCTLFRALQQLLLFVFVNLYHSTCRLCPLSLIWGLMKSEITV